MSTRPDENYLQWMTRQTPTLFWHDSGFPAELEAALERGATGVTCNPVIALKRIQSEPDVWAAQARAAVRDNPGQDEAAIALALVNGVVADMAARVRHVWERTGGRQGQVAAQVNPLQMDEAEPMLRQALAAAAAAPNLAVKIPATRAGMEVIEELAAHGIITLSTVSFSVAQVLAANAAYQRGLERARAQHPHALNYSVMIVGRLDEYLQDKAGQNGCGVAPAVIDLAGLAVTKKCNRLFEERGLRGMVLTGGTRKRHIGHFAGARMCMTIGTLAQNELLADNPERQCRGTQPVDEETVAELRAAFPEFGQAYDEDGLGPDEFTSYPPCRLMHDWFVDAFNQIIDFVRAACR